MKAPKKEKRIIFLIAALIAFSVCYIKYQVQNAVSEQENDVILDNLTKEHFGKSAVRIEDYDEDKNIYQIFGMEGDLEPFYFWHQLLPTNTESNFPSQQMKKDAVDFWSEKDRTIYYVNSVTEQEERLTDDINSMERLFEEAWYLKAECKSESDVAALAGDLAEWTEYAMRKSPYVWNFGSGFSKVTKSELMNAFQVAGEEKNDQRVVHIALFRLYEEFYEEENIEPLKEEIKNILEEAF